MLYSKPMCLERSLRILKKSCFVVYHKDFSRPISVCKCMFIHANTHTHAHTLTHTLKSELASCSATHPLPISHSGPLRIVPLALTSVPCLDSWDPVLKGNLSGSDSLSVLDVILACGLYS